MIKNVLEIPHRLEIMTFHNIYKWDLTSLSRFYGVELGLKPTS